jgi:hypothetical protein
MLASDTSGMRGMGFLLNVLAECVGARVRRSGAAPNMTPVGMTGSA